MRSVPGWVAACAVGVCVLLDMALVTSTAWAAPHRFTRFGVEPTGASAYTSLWMGSEYVFDLSAVAEDAKSGYEDVDVAPNEVATALESWQSRSPSGDSWNLPDPSAPAPCVVIETSELIAYGSGDPVDGGSGGFMAVGSFTGVNLDSTHKAQLSGWTQSSIPSYSFTGGVVQDVSTGYEGVYTTDGGTVGSALMIFEPIPGTTTYTLNRFLGVTLDGTTGRRLIVEYAPVTVSLSEVVELVGSLEHTHINGMSHWKDSGSYQDYAWNAKLASLNGSAFVSVVEAHRVIEHARSLDTSSFGDAEMAKVAASIDTTDAASAIPDTGFPIPAALRNALDWLQDRLAAGMDGVRGLLWPLEWASEVLV